MLNNKTIKPKNDIYFVMTANCIKVFLLGFLFNKNTTITSGISIRIINDNK